MTDGSSGALSSGASEKTECKEHSLKGTLHSRRFQKKKKKGNMPSQPGLLSPTLRVFTNEDARREDACTRMQVVPLKMFPVSPRSF